MSNDVLRKIIGRINEIVEGDIRIMEVCGTHTQVIARTGLAEALMPKVTLISGPGCPVCVTAEGYIDAAIQLLQQKDTLLVTFGDMLRVKGSSFSLEDCMEQKERIKVVYSPMKLLDIAVKNKDKEVIFLAVGFETTAPVIGALVKLAADSGIQNLSFLTALKRMSPVLELVLSEGGNALDGIICPGHVAAIMGADYFRFIPEHFRVPSVISGFEEKDVAAAVYWLTQAIAQKEKNSFCNLYERCVRPSGNERAKSILKEVFSEREGYWRGIGSIEASELCLNENYRCLDAEHRFGLCIEQPSCPTSCRCGDIIIGSRRPDQCMLFAAVCTPENPKGPCMVSSEGSCAIYYRYKRSFVI